MLQRLSSKFTFLFALLAVFGLMIVTADTALAHDRVEVGPYLLIIGWENEPPVVGDRNFLIIDITRDGQPVEDVEATLDLQIVYGGRTLTANLNPTLTPGRYKVDVYPTVRGQYIVEFNGMIEDTAVDVQSEPEEVLPASVLQFPESPPDTLELQSELDELTGQLQTARTMGIAGLAAGILGIIVGAAALLLKRSK